jgi:Tfp pilus assembly protein PilX
MKINTQQGVVLISALLFLLVITVLVMAVVENNILQIKMSSHYIEYAKAFENAESLLTMGESAINPETTQGEATVDNVGNYNFSQTNSDCNNLYYQVVANGKNLNANTQLESMIRLPKTVNCNGQPQSDVKKYELYWLG